MIAVGETASGKTTVLKLIKRLLGSSPICQSSDNSVITDLVKSTLSVRTGITQLIIML